MILLVIPANAGTQEQGQPKQSASGLASNVGVGVPWVPAFAGMTVVAYTARSFAQIGR